MSIPPHVHLPLKNNKKDSQLLTNLAKFFSHIFCLNRPSNILIQQKSVQYQMLLYSTLWNDHTLLYCTKRNETNSEETIILIIIDCCPSYKQIPQKKRNSTVWYTTNIFFSTSRNEHTLLYKTKTTETNSRHNSSNTLYSTLLYSTLLYETNWNEHKMHRY